MKPTLMSNLQNILRRSVCLTLLAASALLTTQAQEVVTINGKGFFTDDIERITFGEVDFYGLPAALAADSRFTLFSAALAETGLADSLYYHFDPKYSVGEDSTKWLTYIERNKLINVFGFEFNVAYPEYRLRKFTLLAETDDVFRANGIRSLSDLKAYAKNKYDDVFPADATITDPTDRRHSLNRFVAYHILPFAVGYDVLRGKGSPFIKSYFDREHEDVHQCFTTYMSEGILKLSLPANTDGEMYANRRGVADHADWYGLFVPGARVTNPDDAPVADNGFVFPIEDILIYNRRVLDDRFRLSFSALSPDFLTSGACERKPDNWYTDHEYYTRNKCYAFKAGSAERFTFEDSGTQLFVTPCYLTPITFQGCFVIMLGNGDVSIKLPVMPAGEWELRLHVWSRSGTSNVPIQFYLDDVSCGEPFDPTTWDTIGWKSDEELGDKEAMLAFDRTFHEAGWMKDCATIISSMGVPYRSNANGLRRVLCRFVSDGHTPHTLRLSPIVSEGTKAEMSLDFLEFCPRSIYDGDKPEDGWLYEKE